MALEDLVLNTAAGAAPDLRPHGYSVDWGLHGPGINQPPGDLGRVNLRLETSRICFAENEDQTPRSGPKYSGYGATTWPGVGLEDLFGRRRRPLGKCNGPRVPSSAP